MAKAKKEIKDANISETKEKKKKIDNLEEIVEEKKKEETVETKKEKKTKDKKKKVGFFGGIRKEMKQVVWPSAGDIVKSTIAVVVMCLFLCLFFLAITALMALIKEGLQF